MDSAISQLTLSAVVVWLLEWLKGAGWFPLVSGASSERMKRLFGASVAALAAVGITYQYDPTAGVLVISGLTLSSVGHFAWVWLQNFVSQQLIYHGIVKNGRTS